MKRQTRKENQDNRPAFNLLRPFSIEAFPELGERNKKGVSRKGTTETVTPAEKR